MLKKISILLLLSSIAFAQIKKEDSSETMISSNANSLIEDARAFYEDAAKKLEELFVKAARARSAIFAQATFEDKRFDPNLRSKLLTARSSLQSTKEAIESIIKEIDRSTTMSFYAQPVKAKN
jgi:hypothetical protein